MCLISFIVEKFWKQKKLRKVEEEVTEELIKSMVESYVFENVELNEKAEKVTKYEGTLAWKSTKN